MPRLSRKDEKDDRKSYNFTVYLHPANRANLDILIADHGERKAIVNGALWLFARQPLTIRVASCRAYHQCNEFGLPMQTPTERLARLKQDISEMEAAVAYQAKLSPPDGTPTAAARRPKHE